VIGYAAKSGKRVIVFGFSIGAAIGLKLMEYTDAVELAFFFYGLPPLESVRA
jgi:predicted esterase